jgi:hypothetical protein
MNINLNIDKETVGLGDVDNTSDTDKPISAATQEALDLKLDAADYNPIANTDELPEGASNLYYTETRVNSWWANIKSLAQTISGIWTFNANVNLNGNLTMSGHSITNPSQIFGYDPVSIYSLNTDPGTIMLIRSGGKLRLGGGSIDAIEVTFDGTTLFNRQVHFVVVAGGNVSGAVNSNLRLGNLQTYTLTGNATLDYSNALPGTYAWKINTAGFTLGLAAGKFEAEGTQTFTGKVLISGFFDGTIMTIANLKDLTTL